MSDSSEKKVEQSVSAQAAAKLLTGEIVNRCRDSVDLLEKEGFSTQDAVNIVMSAVFNTAGSLAFIFARDGDEDTVMDRGLQQAKSICRLLREQRNLARAEEEEKKKERPKESMH